MELIFSVDDFKINGFSYPNFPILLKSNNEIFTEALEFLIFYLIKRGSIRSTGSWKTLAQDLYDFFAFCEANNLNWRNVKGTVDGMLLSIYRDVSMSQFSISASTINRRLRFIIKFYEFALNQRWIDDLPYGFTSVLVHRTKAFLLHTQAHGILTDRPDVLIKQRETKIKVLNSEQVKRLLVSIKNPTLKLMVRLGLLTGLRKSEILTFPSSYVVNPSNTTCRSHIKVSLNPQEMNIKGNEPRNILVPVTLMADLWHYKIHERNALLAEQNSSTTCLFLNCYGKEWSLKSKSFNNQLNKLDLDFPRNPHILRHTFATSTLKNLEERKVTEGLAFNPLLIVQNLLGHKSINTTQNYLHFIHELEEDLTTKYQLEIEDIFHSLK